MIDVKTAVSAVEKYMQAFGTLLPQASPRLEETEVDTDSGDWLITISVIDEPDLITQALARYPRRAYRQFRVDSTTGEVRSMKRRVFAEPSAPE